MHAATPTRMAAFVEQFQNPNSAGQVSAIQLVEILTNIVNAEENARQARLADVFNEVKHEKRIMTVVTSLSPLLLLGLWLLYRYTLIAPIDRISEFLDTMLERNFSQIIEGDLPPSLRPLSHAHNAMATRLAELEQQHQQRETQLEERVETSAADLVRLQGTLLKAERLALIGETAAGIAHELRNPLAGIRTALDNISAEVSDADHARRLALVRDELRRMSSLLNNKIEQARTNLEPQTTFCLRTAIEGVISLARLQTPRHIEIINQVDSELRCYLPEDRFRQAILNLILNSREALGAQPGTVTIESNLQNSNLEVTVLDDGPGFSEAMLQSGPKAFLTSRDGGLSLVSVRRFVQDLGGRMQLGNKEPSGARVTLDIPCEHVDA